MAKKKIANPLFLEFINHPQKGECAGCGPWESVEYSLRNLFEKSASLSDHVHADILKKAINDFDLNNDKYVGAIIGFRATIRQFVNRLIRNPKNSPGEEAVDYFKIFPELSSAGITPHLCRNNRGEFEINLTSEKRTDSYLSINELIRIIASGLVNFLLQNYKPGIFAPCELDGCESIFLKTHGRKKYCCKKHTDEAWRRRRQKNKDRDEYKRIRNKFYKQYKSNQAHQKKWSFEEFLQKEWPEEKYDLYNEFARPQNNPLTNRT